MEPEEGGRGKNTSSIAAAISQERGLKPAICATALDMRRIAHSSNSVFGRKLVAGV